MKKIFLFSLALFCFQENNFCSSKIPEEEIPEETNGDSNDDYENEPFEKEEFYHNSDLNTLSSRERDNDTKLKDIYVSLANSIDNDNFNEFMQILKNNPNIDLNAPLVFRQYTLLQYINKLRFSKYRDAFIKLLYKSGAHPATIHKKYPTPDPTGKTQLMLAIINHDKKRIDKLLQSPLELQFIDHQDNEGNTAFHYDIFNNMGNRNRFLQMNANDTLENKKGITVENMLSF